MGKIIAVVNQKGGVGKTTTTVSLISSLGEKKKKTLLVDIDPQANATSGLGVDKRSTEKTTYDMLIGSAKPEEILLHTAFKGVDLLPSGIALAGAEVEMVELSRRESRLKAALATLRDDYDYILIDCPPSLGLLTINALAAADSAIIPIQSEYYALEGLSQLMNTIKLVVKHLNPALTVEGVALTMYDKRSLISRQISAEIRKFFGRKVFDTEIPRNVRVAEAPSHGVPIMLHDPNCSGAKAYLALTEEFLTRGEKK